MKIPTVHLNGSHGPTLRDQWRGAWKALDAAIAALCEAGPNARDYYVQGPDAAVDAQREHEARIKTLRSMRDDVSTIVESVEEQIFAKEARRG